MYLLGYDIGSSTIKVALVEAGTQQVVALAQYPDQEMDILSRQRGWAEQQPEVWWQHFCVATQRIIAQSNIAPAEIKGIGISYQMHGLVLIDREQEVLRPAIIWCDSRAVPIGQQAFQDLGEEFCLQHLLNSPGNFTAAKLSWVKDNEPEIFDRIDKILLPGDFIAMKLTGVAATTISGLSEGIFWDFKAKKVAREVLDYFKLEEAHLADRVPTFSLQGEVTRQAAERTGLAMGTPISYRAGDQPNNALSLHVLQPGEIAATSGTSGVVYGIVDSPLYDRESRVNAFAHVNYEEAYNRIGTLLCLNGAGIQYSWIKHQIARGSHSYGDMERMVSTVPIGSEGVCVLPFGNGAERMLGNRDPNAHIFNLEFNRHTRGHLYRAALEGVAFSFAYGMNMLKGMGLNIDVLRVGNDNMFQSKTFTTTLATLLGNQIEVVDTTGAIGAAKAAGVAANLYRSLQEALSDIQPLITYEPQLDQGLCDQAYSRWLSCLEKTLKNPVLENKSIHQVKVQFESLHADLKIKSKEIAAVALKLDDQKNFLLELKNTLAETAETKDLTEIQTILRRLSQQITARLNETDDWITFEEHFNLLHSDFFVHLKANYPQLSIPELKFCAFLRMGLATKEIAQKLNISVRGTETRRYRLTKKLALPPGITLQAFLDDL